MSHRDPQLLLLPLALGGKGHRIGIIRLPGYDSPNPPDDHPLVKIFDAAVAPLAELLVSFPDEHPVVGSYKLFFTERAAEHDDRRVDAWIAQPLFEPVKELTAMMAQPLKKLRWFPSRVESGAVGC
ncbi:hypothetical protein B0H13DRAFT_2300993 [Mycena leptocephala]|nr:hypothetical protein B0H13DRAFT_2300993 [Mycena leptocephala]